MLPPPAFVFTVPSIHDGTVLDCRIYNPPSSFISSTSRASTTWCKRAAIVAHPYAPLGGCYDDPIVEIVASELLVDGFVVCTFNFRGAAGSKGRTSWTSKSETNDYVSLIGFMVYFMHHFSMPSAPSNTQLFENQIMSSQSTSKNRLSSNKHTQENSDSNWADPILLLAGYSYGALITTQLPSLSDIHSIFAMPEMGTTAAEIRIRAQQLARQQNNIFSSIMASAQVRSDPSSDTGHSYRCGPSLHDAPSSQVHSASSSIRVGGEETRPSIRRASHESLVRHSFPEAPEQTRKNIDGVQSLDSHTKDNAHSKSSRHHVSASPEPLTPLYCATSRPSLGAPSFDAPTSPARLEKLPSLALDDFQPAYLLISPLQGFITSLATMWTYPSLSSLSASSIPSPKHNPQSELATSQPPSSSPDHNLFTYPTLAVFGTDDIFSSNKKLHAWAARLQRPHNSRFRHIEVKGAGHFWTGQGAVQALRRAVRDFIRDL